MDIGAMGAFEMSNTAVFEQCFGWQGLCVEPNPAHHLVLQTYRSCAVVPQCLAGGRRQKGGSMSVSNTGRENDQRRTFGLSFSGSPGHLRQMSVEELLQTAEEKIASGLRGANDAHRLLMHSFEADCVSLEELLERHGATKGTAIDLVSMDVEGGEFEILTDFPFNQYDIHVFLIEADPEWVFRIDILLLTNGYQKIAVLGKDQVYVKRSHLQFLAQLEIKQESLRQEGIASDAVGGNPFDLVYPPYISIVPYNDTFTVFQRRFLDKGFGL